MPGPKGRRALARWGGLGAELVACTGTAAGRRLSWDGTGGAFTLTCSCLMVSPPLPMTRPALPAGIMISCTVPFWPPLALSWNWPGGPPRPRETMSSSIIFAFLERERTGALSMLA